MSLLKVDRLKVHIAIAVFLALFIPATQAVAAQPCAVDPATGGANILPNVLIIYDNSYSMNLYANVDLDGDGDVIVDYDKDKTYSGIFDSGKQYTYVGTATNLTNTGYFEEDAGGAWSGNFLNWVTALRMDVTRKVMTGGRHTTDNQYTTSSTRVNFVSGYDPAYLDDPDYYTYVNVSIVPRPYPYVAPATADTDQTPHGNDHPNDTYYYTNIGERSPSIGDWSRLLVKDDCPTNFRTYHEPVAGDYVYNIRIKVDSSNLQGLLDELEDQIRVGLMHFNSSNEGGSIEEYVKKLDATHLAALKQKLNRSLGDGWSNGQTTLAETLYEAARFFGQLSPRFSGYTVSQANDPLYYSEWGDRYGCGQNYIIIITDGESTEDRSSYLSNDNIPGTTIKIKDAYPDKADNGTDCDASPCPCDLPGCGYYDKCNCSEYPFCTSCTYGRGSAYLDDVAYFAKNYSLRTVDTSHPTVTTHAIYAFGTGGGVADILLAQTADRGGGKYFTANNAEDLKDNLDQIMNIIMNTAAAAASTAITSEPISGVDLIYIPYYKHPYADQWWGNIRAFRMGSDGSLLRGDTGTDKAYDTDNDLVLDDPKWDATVMLQSKAGTSSRTVYTYIPGETNPYDFSTANAATVGRYFDVNFDADSTVDEVGTEEEVNDLISYIRGNDNPSARFNHIPLNNLRGRMDNYIGDIMHASPIFVGKPGASYDIIYGDSSYWTFFWNTVSRTKVLYAPANDGMLHCFDAETGEEKWAYIPYNLLPHLKWLADPSYGTCHTYYLDLTANVWDMKIGASTPEWKSVLVGGMRLGGTPIGVDHDDNAGTGDITLRSAIFALDVTDPDSINFLWELNDNRFGYTVSKPIPVKVGSNWYLVFGSGPKSVDGEGAPSPAEGYTDNNGYIFVVDPSSGTTTTISLGTLGAGNFFGSPVAIDYDMDYSVDMIYIGDALGNLWRLKTFSDSGTKTYAADPSGWAIDVSGATGVANPQPLLSLGTDQPIVVKPTVSMDERGRVWIYFGTGRYFCASDNEFCGVGNECPSSGSCTFVDSGVPSWTANRSKYMAVGVYDRHWFYDTVHPEDSKFVLQSSTLHFDTNPDVLDHRVLKSGAIVGASTETGYYIVDSTTGEIANDVSTNGWYFHLLDPKERSLGDLLVYQGGVFFISFEPNITDPCSNNGGISYLYGVNYVSGTSTMESIFDLTGEGSIDSDDLVRDAASTDRGGVLIQLRTGYAGGGLKIKVFDGKPMGFTPLPDDPLYLNPPGDEISTGITSWREVLQ